MTMLLNFATNLGAECITEMEPLNSPPDILELYTCQDLCWSLTGGHSIHSLELSSSTVHQFTHSGVPAAAVDGQRQAADRDWD